MIVIPMAGLSRRFSEAGYTLPKYMLEAHGKSLFAHAVSSFSAYAETSPFLFIAMDVAGTEAFIRSEAEKLGICDARIIILDAPTGGQAETVAIGLERADVSRAQPITVFNIDTFRPGFRFPPIVNDDSVAGYLEVFRGSGSNWSYVRPASADSDRVIETTEKVPVSDLCCTGLYHFQSLGLFMDGYQRFQRMGPEAFQLKELYIAPIYNLFIQDGLDIRYTLIARNEVIFCGVPSEYVEFLAHEGDPYG